MIRRHEPRSRKTADLCVNCLEDRAVPASFQGLGALAGGSFSRANGVSADGLVVVGFSETASGNDAFRWTATGGMVDLGPGSADAVSADGSVIGGSAGRWTAANSWLGLGGLPGGSDPAAYGVSADGSVIVGHGNSSSGDQAFRWTVSGGTVGLGTLSGGNVSEAFGVSADGSVVVGQGNSGSSGLEAIQWTASSGMVGLGTLPGGSLSYGTAVSADGLTIVGNSDDQAFRWTANDGMVALGTPPGGNLASYAKALSADGSVIVGESDSVAIDQPFLWTASSGMRNLRDVLVADYGLGTQLSGWTLSDALGCSADGRVIVGTGSDPAGQGEAWIARLIPSRIQQIQINDGSAQRSRVTSLTITFDSPVNLPANPADAFQLTRQSDNASVPLNASVAGNSVTLTFAAGTAVESGSLADGRYTLRALALQINGGNFDGNSDGTPGDDYVLVGNPGTAPNLFRLYGDVDGNGTVDANDFLAFRQAFSQPSTAFDFDENGTMDAADFLQFRLRFLQVI